MALSPGQKKLLTYGIPIVAVLGLFVFLRSRSSSSTGTATATGTTSTGDTAVGVGQLASFENAVQAEISQLAGQLSSGTTTVTSPNPAPKSTAPQSSLPQFISGYYWLSPTDVKADQAAGKAIYALPAGDSFSSSLLIPYNAKTAPTLAPGSHLYIANPA